VSCAFCQAPLERTQPVSFTVHATDDCYTWLADGLVVAAATAVNGAWELTDARADLVTTLLPVADRPGSGDDLGLISPDGRRVGAIRTPSGSDLQETAALDADGATVLVLRHDGDGTAHVIDRRGEVVVLASWDSPDETDVLVTPLGTRQSLAMVFGLLLSLELTRRAAGLI
jgi:hypothetical protein